MTANNPMISSPHHDEIAEVQRETSNQPFLSVSSNTDFKETKEREPGEDPWSALETCKESTVPARAATQMCIQSPSSETWHLNLMSPRKV